MKIKVIGADPSTANFGIAIASVDVLTGEYSIDDLMLIKTEPETKKGVRKDSDDLRRARVVHEAFVEACKDASMVISEIPFTDPRGYASSNFNAGLVTGVLASSPIPIIQVFPQEVKMAFCGSRHAAKEEMIAEAIARFPNAPWLLTKRGGKMVPTKANEHLADACAAINCGLQSDQFKQLTAMFRGMKAA